MPDEPTNQPQPAQQAQPVSPTQSEPASAPSEAPRQSQSDSGSPEPFVHPTLGTLEIRGTEPTIPVRANEQIPRRG